MHFYVKITLLFLNILFGNFFTSIIPFLYYLCLTVCFYSFFFILLLSVFFFFFFFFFFFL